LTKKKNACILSEYRTDKCASCTNLCQHRIALEGLDGRSGRLGSAGLPNDYRGITLANSPAREGQSNIYKILERYVATFKRNDDDEPIKSLYLWSESPGTGKTTTASALISEWIAVEYLSALKRGEHPSQSSAYFLDINELQTSYNLATMTNDDEAMKRMGNTIKRTQRAKFAVIDDIGVRDATAAFRSYVHALVNFRVAEGLPTVYTSNLPIDAMAQVFDARLYDRIRDQCADIHFEGSSKRGRR